MKTKLLVLAIGAIGINSSIIADSIPDEYIVTIKEDQNISAILNAHSINPKFIYSSVFHGFAGNIPPGQLNKLAADPGVAVIVPDNEVFAFGKPSQPPSPTPTQIVPEGIKRIEATPGTLNYTGSGVGVAIVDTGLDSSTGDLKVSKSLFSAYRVTKDDNGHGTHVGGIVAALNNSIGVVGVAPEATLYSVKVLNSKGYGTDSSIIAGLDWVAANAKLVTPNIKVVNMSLGRLASSNDQLMHNAITKLFNLGIAVVVAAGNDANYEVKSMVPAGFSEVIAVASSTAKDGVASSIYGGIKADTASFFTTDGAMTLNGVGITVSAPGEDQENVSDAGGVSSVGILSLKVGGGTTRMSGTSMAAPHVTGVVALLYQKYSILSPDDAKIKLMSSASSQGIAPFDCKTSKGYIVGGYTWDGEYEGILNAPGALTVP